MESRLQLESLTDGQILEMIEEAQCKADWNRQNLEVEYFNPIIWDYFNIEIYRDIEIMEQELDRRVKGWEKLYGENER